MTTPSAHNTAAHQPVRAPRGTALSCKGWQQEAVLRMLMNSLDPEVAERPEDLVISGAAGKAAADWDSFHAIVASLRGLAGDESLRVESGKLAGKPRATARSPRVAATNTGSGEMFGDWLYAGTQTALPVLYEIYADAARQQFGGTFAGKLVAGGSMGGAGGAQPLAAALHGAAFLGIDADAERIKRLVKSGYCEVMVNNLDEALRMLKNAVRQRKSVSIGLIGNCAELFPELARRGVVPDLLTDYATDPRSADQMQGIRDLEKLGTRVIDSGRGLECLRSFTDAGRQLTTWMALSGERDDIARVDRLALDMSSGEDHLRGWLAIARKYVRFQGLPARVAWFKRRALGPFGCGINDLVTRGEISAPILLGYHSTAPVMSAADAASLQNGACWAWVSGDRTATRAASGLSAQAIVADGTTDAAERLALWPGA